MRFGTKFVVTVAVFSVGAGLGWSWKQGWLPVTVIPPATGQVDPHADPEADSEPTPPAVASGPLAEAQDAAEVDPAIFQLQSEPPVEPPTDVALIGRTSTPPARLNDRPPSTRPRESEFAPPAPPTAVQDAAVQPAAFQAEPAASARAAAAPLSVGGGAAPPAGSLADRLAEIDRRLAAGQVLAAHKELSKIYWNEPGHRAEIEPRLEQAAHQVFFAPQPHFIEPYEVQPNDRLQTIAAKYKITWEYLAKLNRTDPRRIQAGQKLKVVRGPFAAVVDLHDYALTVHLQGYYVKRFPVGIGKDGSSPIGKFPVLNKVVNPQYTDPNGKVIAGGDPSNPLGGRWLDLGNSYGIHGTIEPDSVGQAASRGCIRLRDADIEAVYDFLVNGSEVVIRQ